MCLRHESNVNTLTQDSQIEFRYNINYNYKLVTRLVTSPLVEIEEYHPQKSMTTEKSDDRIFSTPLAVTSVPMILGLPRENMIGHF